MSKPETRKKLQKSDLDAFFTMMETCKLRFRTLEDIDNLSFLIMSFFIKKKKVLTGFYALALNAVEHGILQIGYERKAELIAENKWQEEINKRLIDPKFKDTFAELMISRKDGGTYIIITDPGEGFDWKKYITVDPARSGQNHGRGISLAKNLSFDKLNYNETGNQVVAYVSDEEEFGW